MTSGLSDYYEILSTCKAKAPHAAHLEEISPGNSAPSEGTPSPAVVERLSQPGVRELFERQNAQGELEWVFFIPSLRCAACDWVIRSALMNQPGILDAMVSLATLRVVLRPATTGDDRWSAFQAAVATLSRLGYQPFPPNGEFMGDSVVQAQREAWRRTAFAAVCFGNTMLFAAAVYFGERVGIEAGFERLFALLSLALTLPCLTFSGKAFVEATLRAINPRRFQLSIDFPIGLAMIAGLVLSTWHAVAGNPRQVYFDSICGLIFFLNLGRSLQGSLLFRLQRAIARPQELLPAGAFALRAGDAVSVAVGTVVPADGIVTRGVAEVDESLLTGESSPVLRSVGSVVHAGTQIVTGQIDIRAEQTGLETRICRMSHATHAALERPTERLTLLQKATPPLTVFILVAGLIGFAVVAMSGNVMGGFERMLATLIVGCPCAFGLGIPLAYARASGAAAKLGIIVTDMQDLESLGGCRDLVLDKTGTITTGRLEVKAMIPLVHRDTPGARDPRESYSWSLETVGTREVPPAALEVLREGVRRSHHPVSRAIFQSQALQEAVLETDSSTRGEWTVSEFSEEPGKGIAWALSSDTAKGNTLQRCVLGSLSFVQDMIAKASEDSATPWRVADKVRDPALQERMEAILGAWPKGSSKITVASSLYVSEGHGVYLVVLEDELRPEVRPTVHRLQDLGVRVSVLTGDRKAVALSVAAASGIASEDVHAEASPEMKTRLVTEWQKDGKRVALVGDGLNDATALASATVGLAFSSGSALSQRAAGLCLTHASFSPVGEVVLISRRLGKTVVAMLCFSLCYNIATVSLAISGHITPLLAAVLMPSSSLVVALIARGAAKG